MNQEQITRERKTSLYVVTHAWEYDMSYVILCWQFLRNNGAKS